QDREEVVRVLRRLLRLRLARANLRGAGQDRPDLRDELRGGDVRLPRQLDRVELALLVEDRLRRRQVEDGDRRAAERADAAEARDADDAVVLFRALREHADLVADRVVAGVRRLL